MSKYQYLTAAQGVVAVIDPATGQQIAGASNSATGWHLYLVAFEGLRAVAVGERVKANKLIHDHDALDAAVDQLRAA